MRPRFPTLGGGFKGTQEVPAIWYKLSDLADQNVLP